MPSSLGVAARLTRAFAALASAPARTSHQTAGAPLHRAAIGSRSSVEVREHVGRGQELLAISSIVVWDAEAVLTWLELEAATPEIAGPGRELLEHFQFVLIGTLTKDGSPRVNPCEAYVVEGHLLLNMMPRSLKALDLLRDHRVYVHTPVVSKEGTGGEFKLAGIAQPLTDRRLRTKLDQLFWEMIQWRPAPDSHYFEILASRAAYHRYGEDEIALRWPGPETEINDIGRRP
jgi:hypothetical protein